MSYILDALKQSDRDKTRGKIPDIQSQPLLVARSSSKASRIPRYLLVAACVVAVSGVVAVTQDVEGIRGPALVSEPVLPGTDARVSLTLPIEADDPPLRNDEWLFSADSLSGVEKVRINTSEARKVEQAESARYAAATNKVTSKPAPVARSASVSSASFSAPKPVVSPRKPEPSSVLGAEASQTAFAKKLGGGNAEQGTGADPYAGIPHIKQLAAKTRSAIPELNLTVHIFSDTPAKRMVKINGTRLREGDSVARDLVINEITRTGVIFSYKREKFWRSAR